ncbi:MAG: GNAT family N-acetyltransferase [Microscillaceae bacterium]|nr:GNAT family N-acetyltransferase [Microscillaceae bacterium]MDW8459688.1 GNAT family N-acetyltransferase [Cytophagales bacterium]
MVIIEASEADIPTIQDLALHTWFETYKDILSFAQAQYMFEMMYSQKALLEQIAMQKHHFFILMDQNLPQGYASYAEVDKKTAKLQKLYVLPQSQGRGYGKQLLKWIERVAEQAGYTYLILNVNRNNKARFFYEKHGFSIIRQEDIAIGNNYFMNDYVMQKYLHYNQPNLTYL